MFFDRVSKFPRIIHIGNIDIKGKDKQEPNSTITADFVATTFVLLENKPAGGGRRPSPGRRHRSRPRPRPAGGGVR